MSSAEPGPELQGNAVMLLWLVQRFPFRNQQAAQSHQIHFQNDFLIFGWYTLSSEPQTVDDQSRTSDSKLPQAVGSLTAMEGERRYRRAQQEGSAGGSTIWSPAHWLTPTYVGDILDQMQKIWKKILTSESKQTGRKFLSLKQPIRGLHLTKAILVPPAEFDWSSWQFK